jgi:hypothetical protein
MGMKNKPSNMRQTRATSTHLAFGSRAKPRIKERILQYAVKRYMLIISHPIDASKTINNTRSRSFLTCAKGNASSEMCERGE